MEMYQSKMHLEINDCQICCFSSAAFVIQNCALRILMPKSFEHGSFCALLHVEGAYQQIIIALVYNHAC
ncbi:hypothetical protein HKD37_10G026947 [Glycine soja]